MDPPTYPFEEKSFMDGPLYKNHIFFFLNIWHFSLFKYVVGEVIYGRPFKIRAMIKTFHANYIDSLINIWHL